MFLSISHTPTLSHNSMAECGSVKTGIMTQTHWHQDKSLITHHQCRGMHHITVFLRKRELISGVC